MHFQFLGTSAGTPTNERNVTSLALTFEQRRDWYMFDCGEGTQQRILRTSLSLPRLSKIFITHMHGDHCYGLPGLITSRALMCNGDSGLTIYGPKGIEEFVRTVLRLSYTKVRYPIQFHEFTEEGLIYQDDQETVSTVRMSHDVPSFAYVLKESERVGTFDVEKAQAAGIPHGPLYGRLSRGEVITLDDGRKFDGNDFIGTARPGRKIVIGGDNDRPDLLTETLADADLLIHEATHTEKVRESLAWNAKHSTAKSVGQAAHTAQLKNLILTHFSPRFGLQNGDHRIVDLAQEAQSSYTGNLFMAQDYDIFHLDRDSNLSLESRRFHARSSN